MKESHEAVLEGEGEESFHEKGNGLVSEFTTTMGRARNTGGSDARHLVSVSSNHKSTVLLVIDERRAYSSDCKAQSRSRAS